MLKKIIIGAISLNFFLPAIAEDVEESVDTALKRRSTVVDTPAAITAISSTEIDDKVRLHR